jgi:periplasmic divalent cation tolerance protein
MHLTLITAPPDQANALAKTLVAERLCACVNVVPAVTSHYIWEGKPEEDTEALLIAKVSADRLAAFTARVKELHPYSVPEVVALDVVGGNAEYIEWVKRGGG